MMTDKKDKNLSSHKYYLDLNQLQNIFKLGVIICNIKKINTFPFYIYELLSPYNILLFAEKNKPIIGIFLCQFMR